MKRVASALGKLNCGKRVSAVFVLCATMAIALPAQTLTTVNNTFLGTLGSAPGAGLAQGPDGNLYGTTAGGGTYNSGTVFRITPSGTLTTLYSFCSQIIDDACADGGSPVATLVPTANGDFYGTTATRGAGAYDNGYVAEGFGGTVFKITPSGVLTTLYSFCSQSGCTDGDELLAGLVQGTDGNFYGTTADGGGGEPVNSVTGGTVFRITPGGMPTTLYSFCSQSECTDGDNPSARLVQATDGDLYGTTRLGGAPCYPSSRCGTVFKITPTGTLTTLYSFCSKPNASGVCADGQYPVAALIQGTDGNLYGTTPQGGANNNGNGGTVFRLTPSGVLTTLYTFCSQLNAKGLCADGQTPMAGLVQATDGSFYGTTEYGGLNFAGTVFKITPNGVLTTLYSFCSQGVFSDSDDCADGALPVAGLVQTTNGDFYGTTSYGEPNGAGTVFSLSVGLAPFVETLPALGSVGAAVQILGTNLTGATSVTFNGTAATFTLVSSTLITTTVPSGASTGEVQVTTPSGTLLSNAAFVVQGPAPAFTVALSTAGQVEPFAAQSIVSAYGTNLATGTASASSLPIPTSLDGTTVTVTDSAGAARLAPLFYVSPAQVNCEIPAGTATGTATVSIQNQNGTIQTATIQIGNVSPGLFALNGSGLVAAWVLPVISGVQQPLQPVYQISSGSVVPLPINLGPSTEQVYLEMYGTGIRNANSVTALVGGLSVPVLYGGPAPGFAGEDQVNVGPVPQSLTGAGSVNIVLTAGGQAANTVNVTMQ